MKTNSPWARYFQHCAEVLDTCAEAVISEHPTRPPGHFVFLTVSVEAILRRHHEHAMAHGPINSRLDEVFPGHLVELWLVGCACKHKHKRPLVATLELC
jgi:hypothetical protein